MLKYCQLDPSEQTSVEFNSKFMYIVIKKICIWKCLPENGSHFVSVNVLSQLISLRMDQILIRYTLRNKNNNIYDINK